jgi:hypothetical protein
MGCSCISRNYCSVCSLSTTQCTVCHYGLQLHLKALLLCLLAEYNTVHSVSLWAAVASQGITDLSHCIWLHSLPCAFCFRLWWPPKGTGGLSDPPAARPWQVLPRQAITCLYLISPVTGSDEQVTRFRAHFLMFCLLKVSWLFSIDTHTHTHTRARTRTHARTERQTDKQIFEICHFLINCKSHTSHFVKWYKPHLWN